MSLKMLVQIDRKNWIDLRGDQGPFKRVLMRSTRSDWLTDYKPTLSMTSQKPVDQCRREERATKRRAPSSSRLQQADRFLKNY